MSWTDRLREAVRDDGRTQVKIAMAAGVPEGTLRRLMTGETKNPQIGTLSKIARALGVNVGWLRGERGFDLSLGQKQRLRAAAEIIDVLTRDRPVTD